MAATAATATEGTTASRPHDAGLDGRPDHGAAAARTEELYRDHGRLVGGLCRALLRDRAEAEDAAQQAFLAAHRALLNGTTPREPAAWLATIARNECWARIRARMREPLPTDAVDGAAALSDPLAEAIRNADLAALWRAVAELPPQQRDALLLREFGGLSYEELAGALAVSGSAVESLLFRARQGMRTRLEAAYAGLTGASWIEALSRLAGGIGGGMAPVAAKVAAVGVGAAVATGGAVVAPTMLEHVRHDAPASAPAKTTKGAPPAHAAPRLPIFVARTPPSSTVAAIEVGRSGRRGGRVSGSDSSGRSSGEDRGTRNDEDAGGDRGAGSSESSSSPGDLRDTTERTSRSGHGDGSGSSADDRAVSGDDGDSATTGGGSPDGSGSSSGGHDSSSGDGSHGSSGGDRSGGDGGSGGGDSGSGGGDSGSGDGGVVTTVPNLVVTVTVASGDASPASGVPPPGDDG
jgi:RNA polymerase sigma factor (sigma-70 family)